MRSHSQILVHIQFRQDLNIIYNLLISVEVIREIMYLSFLAIKEKGPVG